MKTYLQIPFIFVSMLFGCEASNTGIKLKFNIHVETAANGSGSKVKSLDLFLNTTHEIYVIKRDDKGNFVEAVTGTWSTSDVVGIASASGVGTILSADQVGQTELTVKNSRLATTLLASVTLDERSKLTVDAQEQSLHQSTVTVKGECLEGFSVNVGEQGERVVQGDCIDGRYKITYSLSSGDGSKALEVWQDNASGIRSSGGLTVVRDSTAPILTQDVIAVSSGEIYESSLNQVTWGGDCEDGGRLVVSLTDEAEITCTASRWSYTTAMKSSDGSYTYQFSHYDDVGNVSETSVTWLRDTTVTSSWDFSSIVEYIYNALFFDFSSGSMVELSLVDQNFVGTDFYRGVAGGVGIVGGELSLKMRDDASLGQQLILSSKAANLIGYWNYESGFNDSSGSGHHATSTLVTQSVDSKIGDSSARFDDGASSYLGVAASGVLDVSTAFSISTWVKSDTFGSDIASSQVIFSKGTGSIADVSNNTIILFVEENGADDYIRLAVSDGSTMTATDMVDALKISAFKKSRWYHLTALWNGTELKLYVDGVNVTEKDFSGSLQSLPAADVNIGRLGDGSSYFSGKLDETSFWNTGLTDSDVASLFDQQKFIFGIGNAMYPDWTPRFEDISLYLPLDEDWQDQSNKSNDGTPSGGPTHSSVSYQVGRGAASFTGGEDVEVSDNSSIDISGDISVSFWFNTSSGAGTIFSKRSGNVGYEVSIDSAGKIVFFTGGGAGFHELASQAIVNDGSWHHFLGTYDSSQVKKVVYIDGVEDNVAFTSRSAAGSGASLFLGSRSNSNYYTGLVDELAIWPNLLAENFVEEIYSHQRQAYSGYFISSVIDLGQDGSWTGLTPSTNLPYGKEIPAVQETSGSYPLTLGTLSGGVDAIYELNGDVSDTLGVKGGTAIGALTYSKNSVLGTQSAHFDGVDDSISLPSTILGTQNTSGMTFSAWVRPSTVAVEMGVVGAAANGTHSLYGSGGLRVDSSGRAVFTAYDGSSYIDAIGPVLDINVWTHLVGSYDAGTDLLKIYVNSAMADSQSATSVEESSAVAYVGRNTNSSGSENFFSGQIDSVNIWGRPLTDSEITELYRRGANRIQYQVRSCIDASCACKSYSSIPAGDSSDCDGDGTANNVDSDDLFKAEWLGANGDNTFFGEAINCSDTTSGVCASGVSDSAPVFDFSAFPAMARPSDNRYFQFRLGMFAEQNTGCAGSLCAPSISEIEFRPVGRFYAGSPYLQSVSKIDYADIQDITFQESGTCTITYQLSPDGINFYFFSGGTWTLATAAVGDSNTSSTVRSAIGAFSSSFANGSLYLRVFMTSDTTQSCSLADVSVKYH